LILKVRIVRLRVILGMARNNKLLKTKEICKQNLKIIKQRLWAMRITKMIKLSMIKRFLIILMR
jgi:hypothetical protein